MRLIRRPALMLGMAALLAGACIVLVVREVARSTRTASVLTQARTAMSRDDLLDARKLLTELLQQEQNIPAMLLMVRVGRNMSDWAAAEHWLGKAGEQGASPDVLAFERKLLRVHRGFLDEYGNELEKFLTVDVPDVPEKEFVYEALCRGLMVSHVEDRALYHLDGWIKFNPQRPAPHAWKGMLLLSRNNPAQARQEFLTALNLNPNHYDARLALAQSLTDSSQFEEAGEHLEILRRALPHHPSVIAGLAMYHTYKGDGTLAEEYLAQIPATAQENVLSLALYLRGAIANQRQDGALAEKKFTEYLRRHKNDPKGMQGMITALRLQNKETERQTWQDRFDAAKANFDKINQLRHKKDGKDNPDVLQEIGQAFLNLEKSQEAVMYFNMALHLQPDHRPSHKSLAAHYQSIGRADLAERHEAALTKN